MAGDKGLVIGKGKPGDSDANIWAYWAELLGDDDLLATVSGAAQANSGSDAAEGDDLDDELDESDE